MEPRITTGATNSARKSIREDYTKDDVLKLKEDFLNIEHKLFTESAKHNLISVVSDVVTIATGEPERTTKGGVL
jgi:hypothetical protein